MQEEIKCEDPAKPATAAREGWDSDRFLFSGFFERYRPGVNPENKGERYRFSIPTLALLSRLLAPV